MEIIKTNLKFAQNMSPLKPNKAYLIILHHRCGTGDIESIHKTHLAKGWAGCGYHFYIRFDGKVYEGRPVKFIGAHCAGNNSMSIGICLEGDFRKVKPTKEQIESLKELVVYLKKKFPTIKKVLNHNDLYKTACPVVNLKEMI